MENRELSTEQIILEAAESEFIEKGYGNTKMMAIAKRANVAHSMLHYYFRNKENLFQTIFLKKAQTITSSFEGILEQNQPFFEILRNLIEAQFNFVAQNPRLPQFILSEIVTNKDNRSLLFKVIAPKALTVIPKFEKMLEEEVAKGSIRPINFYDLFLNIISLNVSTFLALPVIQDMVEQDNVNMENLLAERLESNVRFILAALKP